jgi:hypothetical protein
MGMMGDEARLRGRNGLGINGLGTVEMRMPLRG